MFNRWDLDPHELKGYIYHTGGADIKRGDFTLLDQWLEFNRLQAVNPVSPAAYALWNRLLYKWNEAGFMSPLILRVNALCGETGLSESAYKRARHELWEKKYIQYYSQSGNQPPIIFMRILKFKAQQAQGKGRYNENSKILAEELLQ